MLYFITNKRLNISYVSIFSHRVIQRLIGENSEFLTKSQLEKHIDNLNKYDPHKYLDYEWEVVVMNAFSEVGETIYEPGSESSKNKNNNWIVINFEKVNAAISKFVLPEI